MPVSLKSVDKITDAAERRCIEFRRRFMIDPATVSNKDINGYELPWLLVTCPWSSDRFGAVTRSKIVGNPRYSHEITDYRALACAMGNAAVQHDANAARAVEAHMRDAHLWT